VTNLAAEEERVGLLFGLVTEAVARSGQALLSEDHQLGQGVIAGDNVIDELTAEIQTSAWDRLKRGSGDWDGVRATVGVLLILPELERSADLAAHIAQRSLTGIGAEMTPRSRGIIQQMSDVAENIWVRTAKAYVERISCPDELDEADDELDVLHEQLSNEVASGSMDPGVAAQVTLLSRFYERLGDHAVNLARRIDRLPE
jgi:phosphate transport system protein